MSNQRISNLNSYRKKKTKEVTDKPEKRKFVKADVTLLVVIAILTGIGLVAVFSSSISQSSNSYGQPFYYSFKHLQWVIVGFVIFLLGAKIDYRNWDRWAIPVSSVIIALIGATLIPGLGRAELGSSRWLTFLPIQPSEFGKFACILLGAYALKDAKSMFDKKVLKAFGLIAIMMFIIFKQPNLSILLLLMATSLGMFLVAGMKIRIIITAILGLIPVITYIILTHPYQMERIRGWLNPFLDAQGNGYQLIQSWYAIASGGLFGVGIGLSKQKLNYLPFSSTDFVFSILGEEMGFIGCCVIILLFLLLINRGFRIATKCPDSFGRILAFGITFIIAAQAFINMAVATGVFPTTGVTLPLISYGGSSFMVTAGMLGVLVNISRHRAVKEKKDEKKKA